MLSAYFDESGTHDNPVFTLGGYLFTHQRLVRFEREWKAVLAKFGVISFHAVDLENAKRDFAGWDGARRDDLLSELVRVINQRAVLGVGVLVDTHAFARYASHLPKEMGSPYHKVLTRSAYAICLARCLDLIIDHQEGRDHSQEKIACICDERELKGTVSEIYEGMKRSIPWGTQFGEIAFASDHDLVGLQAADLLAYMLRKGGIDYFRGRPSTLRRGYLNLRPSLHRTALLDEKSASILLEQLGQLVAGMNGADDWPKSLSLA